MEEFIKQENRRLYHPARMHLRDPQKVGMLYVSTLFVFMNLPCFVSVPIRMKTALFFYAYML